MFVGNLSNREYARATAVRIGSFVAATVIFPFLLAAIVKSTKCGIDTCGAVSLVASLFLKPSLYLIFAASFVGISVRRTRDLGLPFVLGLCVPVLLLGDVMFGATLGAPWSLNFVLGGMRQMPRYLITAFICVGFLCTARSSDTSDDGSGRWGFAGALALGIVVPITIFAVLNFCRDAGSMFGGFALSQFFSQVMVYYSVYGTLILLIGLLGFVVWHQRRAHLTRLTAPSDV